MLMSAPSSHVPDLLLFFSLLLLSESRRSWQKSAWTLHAIAQQGQRVTISSNGSPPSWAQPIPRELLFRTTRLWRQLFEGACAHALQKGVFPLKSPCLFSPVPLTFLFLPSCIPHLSRDGVFLSVQSAGTTLQRPIWEMKRV